MSTNAILKINKYNDHYDFQIILGKDERDKFEARRSEFPESIQDLYDNERTLHDGKWLLIRVEDMETLEVVKKLILIKKKPNRKPFPKEDAVYSDCGHRCDLCIHYDGGTISEEFRIELKECLMRVYGGNWEDIKLCSGCSNGGFSGNFDCDQRKCAAAKEIDKCINCGEYPCEKSTVGWPPKIELKSVLAEDVTWAILPYVEGQYGN